MSFLFWIQVVDNKTTSLLDSFSFVEESYIEDNMKARFCLAIDSMNKLGHKPSDYHLNVFVYDSQGCLIYKKTDILLDKSRAN